MKVASSISFRAVRAAAINHIRWYNLHYITIQITITWPGTSVRQRTPARKNFRRKEEEKRRLFPPLA